MLDRVDRLVSHWKGQGLVPAAGNSEATLAAFEAQNSLRLPPEMRHYLHAANGMPDIPGSESDSNGFRFWPLEQIRSVPAVCADAGVPMPLGEGLDRYFVFADFLDWSWAYAINLSSHDPDSQPIIHVGTLEPKTVAGSFGEFIDLYLQDAKMIYVESRGAE